MQKLNDTQAVLLVHAAQRETGSLYPLPAAIVDGGSRIDKSVAGLLKRRLVEERETTESSAVHRTEDDARFGLFVTSSGLAALNIEPDQSNETSPAPNIAAPPERRTKSDLVKSLLERSDGATLPEIIEATGWLPHSTRAALTGLRKKGLTIERFSRDGVTCYRTKSAA